MRGGTRLPKGSYAKPRIIRLPLKNLLKGSVVLQFARHLHYYKDREKNCKDYDCRAFLNRLGETWMASDWYFKSNKK